jgi:hypothetical protein
VHCISFNKNCVLLLPKRMFSRRNWHAWGNFQNSTTLLLFSASSMITNFISYLLFLTLCIDMHVEVSIREVLFRGTVITFRKSLFPISIVTQKAIISITECREKWEKNSHNQNRCLIMLDNISHLTVYFWRKYVVSVVCIHRWQHEWEQQHMMENVSILWLPLVSVKHIFERK